MLDLGLELRICREAESRFRAGLARLFAEAGLELVHAAPRAEGHWSVELRPVVWETTAAEAPVQAPAVGAVASDVDLRPLAEVEPARLAEPVVARPGEGLIHLVERGDPRLMVSPVREEIVGLRSAPLEPAERVRLLAVTMVGDAFLDLRHRAVDPASAPALEAVERARTSFGARAAEEGVEDASGFFAAALQAHAPAEDAALPMEA